jgi:signal transduction histidine kinase
VAVTEPIVERATRVVAPATFALFVAIGAGQSSRPAAASGAVGLIAVAAGVFIAWRDWTGWPLVTGLAGAAAGVVVLCHDDPSNVGWFAMCVLAGWAALGAPLLPAVVLGAGLVGVFVAEWTVSEDQGWGPWIVGTIFTTTAFAFSRRQRQLVGQLREAQAGLAERARAEERNRISAEVHDVIGHALTVSLLHLGSARLALDDEPDEARAALAEAERLTRESLDEVRAALSLARTADPTDIAPMPSATDLPELVDTFRRAGATVELVVCGDLATLGGTRGLALYRIVQESLTNATRHGDGSPVSVHVAVGPDETMVTVLNGGTPRPNPTGGSGLVGMSERAQALGGRLRAEPSPNGWRVEAVLPS